MKMIPFLLTSLILSGQILAQDRSAEGIPTTEEEEFYSGDQVNEDAFSTESNPAPFEEESLAHENEEIIYPYEAVDLDEESYEEPN